MWTIIHKSLGNSRIARLAFLVVDMAHMCPMGIFKISTASQK